MAPGGDLRQAGRPQALVVSDNQLSGLQRLGPDERQVIAGLARLARVQATALGRIARAYEQHMSGRCDADRLREVVRQELQNVHRQTRQARRRSRPVRG